jgi:fatty-acyl-CoA synthase
MHRRVCRLAGALKRLGVVAGDRIGTLSWNHYRHLEAYFAIPCSGAVLHTLNLRLHPSEIAYVARTAADKVILVDRSLLPMLEKFKHEIPCVEKIIVIPDAGPAPEGYLDYETLLAAEPEHFDFPRLDENQAAGICFTSGTTGNPKGVVYSHRSSVLHALVSCQADSLGITQEDSILPVVPMFHANAWGIPYSAVAAGTKIVFPGPAMDPASLLKLMVEEKVTQAAGVPTIWLDILQMLDASPGKFDLSCMRSMVIGGAAVPPSMLEGFSRRHGLTVLHAWGMTETSPLGSLARVKPSIPGLDDAKRLDFRASQGYPVTLVETRHVGPDGQVLPWDGTAMGELEVRGPWVAASYMGDEDASKFTADGWFKTGDVVTIDSYGYLRITDRAKDVIKSGGEWISSVTLENVLMSHPAILEAAVFAGRHPKWDERPLAAIVLRPGQKAEQKEINEFLSTRVAKFWIPDAYIFLDQVPRSSTGKFLKTKLREDYGEMLMK